MSQNVPVLPLALATLTAGTMWWMTYRAYKKFRALDPPRTESDHLEGRPDGLRIVYDEYGRKISECHNTNGGRTEEVWHHPKRGHPVLMSFYKNGRLHGRCKSFHADDTIHGEYDYVDGKLIRVVSLRDEQGRECVLPDGDLIVWKVAKSWGAGQWHEVLIRLSVPSTARRVTPVDTDHTYKSRVEYAKVEEIVGGDGTQYREAVSSIRSSNPVTYRVGEIAVPDTFDDDPNHECAAGINVYAHRDHCDA